MEDPLRERLAHMRAYADSAKRRAGLYSEIAKVGGGDVACSLGALRRAPAPGKKMQKVGFIMLWIPEPTGITCAIGGPMIVAGRYLEKKYNSSTIADIGRHASSTAAEIRDIRQSIT